MSSKTGKTMATKKEPKNGRTATKKEGKPTTAEQRVKTVHGQY